MLLLLPRPQKIFVWGLSLAVLMMSHEVFADVFAPASCESLYATDLVAEMTHEIDYRIEGLTANDSTKKIYTTRGNATDPWTRSATAWTMEGDVALDLTGASPWNSNSNFTKAGVLISPRHIVFATHFPIANGSTIVFVADDNTIVTRTLQAQTSVIFQPGLPDDVQLGVLDSDVPASIAFYPVVSKAQVEQYFSQPLVPFVLFDQEQKALLYDQNYLIGQNDGHAALTFSTPAATTTRNAFSEALVNGDSGQPAFFLIDNQPTLALTITGDGYGPFYGAYIDAINDAIVDLGNSNGYQVSTYDLSCFDLLNQTPEVTDETFTLVENSTNGASVGTITASDVLGGATLTYAIVSGNTNDAFTLDPDTGALAVATEEEIDFETNPTFELVISATDDWWFSTAGTGTITINLQDELEAVAPTVLTVAASSITSTEGMLNGSISATGGQDATSRGFIHGTSVSYGATTTEEGTFSTGAFSTTLSSLTCNTTYYFKAWASNPLGGLSYGSHRTLTTSACEEEEEDGGGGGGGGGGSGGGSRNSDDETEDEASGVVTNPSLTPALRGQILSQLKILIKELIALGGTPSQSALVFIGAIPATSTPVNAGMFVRDLDVGMSGSDVVRLQQVLIVQNKGPHAQALAANGVTGLFGPLTQSALAELQMSVGIAPASGFFGPVTRAYINRL